MREVSFPQLCEPINLMTAWLQIRQTLCVTGDSGLVAEYEQHLENNLYDLAARLAAGAYCPPLIAAGERGFAEGLSRGARLRLLEDLIVQQTARRVLEEIFEPQFLDCSFGFRPWRNAQTAVSRVLEHRARGDAYIVLSGISLGAAEPAGIASLEHDAVLQAVAARIKDPRMLNLIRAWLSGGWLSCPDAPLAQAARSTEMLPQLSRFAPEPLRAMLSQLQVQGRPGHGDGKWETARPAAWLGEGAGDETEKLRRMLKDIAARFGRDALLVSVTSLLTAKSLGDSPRELLKPKQIALTAAALLAMAAYPQASQALRERNATNAAPFHSPPSPLAPLLLNILLHHFDLALSESGWHLVRYGGSFAVTAHNEAAAHAAYQSAARELRRMRLPLDAQTTRLKRFDQGVEFLGYRFHDQLIAAAPILNEHALLDELLDQAAAFLKIAPPRFAPATAQLGVRAKERVTTGLRRIRALIARS